MVKQSMTYLSAILWQQHCCIIPLGSNIKKYSKCQQKYMYM